MGFFVKRSNYHYTFVQGRALPPERFEKQQYY